MDRVNTEVWKESGSSIRFDAPHDLLVLRWIEPQTKLLGQLQGRPTDQHYYRHVFNEKRVNHRHIYLLPQENDRNDIDKQGEDLAQKDNTVHICQCGIDVEQFRKDERCESDGHHSRKTFLK